MSNLISIGFGDENFKEVSVKLSTYLISKPFIRKFPGHVMAGKKRNVQSFPASAHPEINGTLYLETLEVPEGTLLLAQASHRRGGVSTRDGAFFFRTRTGAPLWVITAALPNSPEALQTGRFMVIQAQGDILSIEEVENIHGLELPRNFENNFMQEEELTECFLFQKMSEGTAKPEIEVIKREDGTDVFVETKKRTRRIRVR